MTRVPLVLAHIREERGRPDPRIVVREVETAERVDTRLDGTLYGVAVRDIGLDEDGRAAGRFDQLERLVSLVENVADDHVRAAPGK